MVFEYLSRTLCDASIDIEDIGNCALCAYTLASDYSLMVVKTTMGTTEIFTCGPVACDGSLCDYVGTSYRKFPYSDSKIKNAITKFVNTAGVMQVVECPKDEIAKKFVNIAEYICDEC